MNVIAAARSFNQRALRHNWHMACDPTLAFTDPFYRQILALWHAKAGDHKMPIRSQMSARDLKDHMRHIILVQRETRDPSSYRWRLIGTSVTQIVGEHTGKLFDDSVPGEHLARWNGVCDMILESEQPWRFLGRVHVSGREYLKAENLYLPLADENAVPCYVMGYCRYTPRFAVNDTEMDEDLENEIASIPGGLL
jgi:hypothetical protein